MTYEEHLDALAKQEKRAFSADVRKELSKQAARARLVEMPSALPAGSSDGARCAAAAERAQMLAIVTDTQSQDLEANGNTFNFRRPEPPEAA